MVNPVSIFWVFVIIVIIIMEVIRRYRQGPDNKVSNYVKKCREHGFSDESISSKLESHGIAKHHIEKAMKK